SNPDSARSYLQKSVEPRLRAVMLPLIVTYKQDSEDEVQADLAAIKTAISRDDRIIAGTTFGAIAVAVVTGLLMARSIAHPLKLLQASTERVGRGDLSAGVRIQRRDEVGALALAFEQMLAGLQATMVSRSYLDVVLNSMSSSLIAIDGDGRIQKVNQATLDLLGYTTTTDILGHSIGEIGDEQVGNAVATLLHEGQESFCEATYVTRVGQAIAVDFSVSPLHDDRGHTSGAVCIARDARSRRRSERALRESEERYALVARAANDGLWDWDLHSNEVYYSSRWKSMLGYADDEIGADPEEWFARIRRSDRERVRDAIESYIEQTTSHFSEVAQMFELEYPVRHRDGNIMWMLCRGIAVRDEGGAVCRLAGTHTDLTQRKHTESQLRHAASHDTLTGLPNRAFFTTRLQTALDNAQMQPDYHFAVLFLDLDRFKVINDSLGHHIGDRLLQAFAERLQGCVRDRDNIARLGGDEFAILLDRIGQEKEATAIADRIQTALTEPFDLGGRDVFVSTSIGIALNTTGYERIEALLRDADTAMYHAKASGKARYAIFDSDMHVQAVNRLHLENDLRRAIEREEFVVHYQPIVELRSGRIAGFEALIRWQHPERGLVPPNEFVPIAEETEAIVPIGWWVMRRACEDLQQWHQQFPDRQDLTVSVNLSGKQFVQLDSNERIAQIVDILHETQLQPRHLKLEITESVVIENNAIAARAFEHLGELGIHLAMDDFGTGYSSLSYLHRMHVQTLKVDRSFVCGIESEPEKIELVRAVSSLATAFGLDIVAEGIETTAQQERVVELGCVYGQGYLFSKPVPAPNAIELLTQSAIASSQVPIA
ncbi:MAG: EAL domain-containing protein, partial [Cyanobacteria bacterium J06639_1]